MATQQKRFRKDDGNRNPPKEAPNVLDRSPPFDLAAETGVIGSLMLNPDAANELSLVLRADDFYDDANRKLYSAMMNMFDSGRKFDTTLLVNELKASGDFELVGGFGYLAKTANSVPNAAHAVYYAEIVRKKATLRRLIEASTSILADAYDESFDAKELVSQAEQRIFQIQDERNANSAASVGEVLKAAMDRIDLRMQGHQLNSGVLTHFTDFDSMTGGFHDGELVILAARPSMGKTAFAMNIAEQVAMKENAPVLFVSLEMNSIELVDRLLCSVAKVNGKRLRTGTISQDDQKRLISHAAKIALSPLYIDDAPSRTVSEVAAVARRITQQELRKPNGRKLGLIVIDYLQLLEPDNPKDPRQEQVAKIARRLKMLAREQKVPILCLSQLNRQAEDSKDHKPKLSHLRESGAIEQDADVVMFVHREGYYHRGEGSEQYEGQAEIIIAKQRNGPVGEIELIWEGEFTRFLNKAPERHEEFSSYSDFSTPGGY
ncbi:MAG: replicative DNA helicase [Planctomycetota bacterium]|jgi:replicative DNA helicase|nr:replicative DNA helicase [Planctomycetota bacterium]